MKNTFQNIAFFNVQMIHFVIGISLFIVSCETSEKSEIQNIEKRSRNTLRINFEENILTLNPRAIASQSEKFVGFLLYEGLYKLNNRRKPVPALLEQCFLDSLSNTFFFKIKSSIAFQNGEFLNSGHIYSRFKEIIDFEEEEANDEIRRFRNDIKGFKKYSIRKSYKIGNDSLPKGFKIIDALNFSIQFTKPQPELFTLLSKPDFWIYQIIDNKYIGTGPYILTYANEDISYLLTKNKNYHTTWEQGLDNINIRFIKNKDARLNEFLNGSLDLLVQKPNSQNDVLDNQYAHYRKIKGSQSLIKHLSVMNMSNPYMEKLMLQLLAPNNETTILKHNENQIDYHSVVYSEDTVNYYAQKLHFTDSTAKLKIPIILDCKQNCRQEAKIIKAALSKYYEIYEVNRAEINPFAPYIVINESIEHIYTAQADSSTLLKLLKLSQNSKYANQTLLILEYQRAKIFTNIMLKGLSPHTDWTKELDKLYFTEPKVY